MSDTLLTLRDVHINFPARKNWLGKTTEHVHAINGIDLQIRRGETLGIVGESGCGKSTLAQLLMGMLQPSHGQYIRSGSQRIMQMVFQDPLSSLNPRLPVWRIITEPLWIAKRSSEQQRRALAEELAVQVGIRPEYLDRLPHAFSGGQRQRIAIARALSSQPDVIVLDEPTSALDISVQAQILNLLVTLQVNRGLTYVLISHNVSVIRHMSDRVAVMVEASIPGTATSLFSAIFVIAKPASTLSSDTSAVVSIDVGVNPASPSINESAIEKHAACAAPISSSGLVPFSPSKRVLNPYGCWFSTPLSVDTVPFPRLISPSQCA